MVEEHGENARLKPETKPLILEIPPPQSSTLHKRCSKSVKLFIFGAQHTT